jgi:membrane-associated phospholipid phosphatase
LRDALTRHDFTLLSRPHVDFVAHSLIALLEPPLFVIWGALLVAVALARGRPRVALAVVFVMALAPLTAEILKPLLVYPHPRFATVDVRPPSWPSGHSTAALTVVLCTVLVTAPRLRALVTTLGGVYALAVGCSLLILAWHMPSDVLGGYLLAALWMAIAVAILRIADRRWPSTSRRSAASARAEQWRSGAGGRRAGSVRAGVPERLLAHTRGAQRIHGAAEDEQQVRQSVEVAHDLWIDVLPDGNRATLGTAADGAADMQVGSGGRAAGNHE